MSQTSLRGPVGDTRSIGLSILWAILTLGIYTFVWVYKTHNEIERYGGNGIGGVVGLVVYILISPVTYFVVPSEVRHLYEDLDGGTSPVRGITGLPVNYLITVNFLGFKQIVDKLGGVWMDVDRRYYNKNTGSYYDNYANINLQPG